MYSMWLLIKLPNLFLCKKQGFGAGAVTLARLRLYLEYLFNNSRKLHGTLTSFDVFSKVNIKYDLHVLVHVLERILDNS